MRTQITDNQVVLWLSADDTYQWATKPGATWPCSFLSGRRFVTGFDKNGIYDLTVNGGRGDQDCPGDELSAIVADMLYGTLAADHPAYFVTVGQFRNRCFA